MVWQRVLSLQVLRWLLADPLLLYTLFQQYDMSIHHDLNAVHDTASLLIDIIKVSAVACWSILVVFAQSSHRTCRLVGYMRMISSCLDLKSSDCW
jgi:hypothetical protein